MPFVLFADSKIEMRGRDSPTGRAKFVNTNIPAMNETRTRVQNNICINDLGVTISSTNLASDSIFETRRGSVADPGAVEA